LTVAPDHPAQRIQGLCYRSRRFARGSTCCSRGRRWAASTSGNRAPLCRHERRPALSSQRVQLRPRLRLYVPLRSEDSNYTNCRILNEPRCCGRRHRCHHFSSGTRIFIRYRRKACIKQWLSATRFQRVGRPSAAGLRRFRSTANWNDIAQIALNPGSVAERRVLVPAGVVPGSREKVRRRSPPLSYGRTCLATAANLKLLG
jgi:hypothetical protein